MANQSSLDRALSHTRRNTTEWHDFCASIGQIPENVAHMRHISALFAESLEETGRQAARKCLATPTPAAPIPMSLAALKRRLVVGARIKLVYRSMDGVKNQLREVIKVQSNAVVFQGADPRPLWLYWQKGHRAFDTGIGFELRWQRADGVELEDRFLRYEWVI